MIRFTVVTFLACLAGMPLAEGAGARQPVSDVRLSLARVPGHREGKIVPIGADGRFRVEGATAGTWTMTVSVPDDYLEKWIAADLKRRNWKRGEVAAAKGVAAADSKKGKGGKKASEGGAKEFRVLAVDDQGAPHQLEFSLFVTVEKTENKGGPSGNYSKPMRWQHLERGLSFKFDVGKRSGGVITGVVERVVAVDPAPATAAAR